MVILPGLRRKMSFAKLFIVGAWSCVFDGGRYTFGMRKLGRTRKLPTLRKNTSLWSRLLFWWKFNCVVPVRIAFTRNYYGGWVPKHLKIRWTSIQGPVSRIIQFVLNLKNYACFTVRHSSCPAIIKVDLLEQACLFFFCCFISICKFRCGDLSCNDLNILMKRGLFGLSTVMTCSSDAISAFCFMSHLRFLCHVCISFLTCGFFGQIWQLVCN